MICAGGTSVGATKRTVTELDVPVLVRTACITPCSYQILSQSLLHLGCSRRRARDTSALTYGVFFIEYRTQKNNDFVYKYIQGSILIRYVRLNVTV